MKIFINTFGSRGDVQPYVALGVGLQAAGHSVTICTASTFESFIRAQGLGYGYMTDELLKLMDSDIGREAIEDTVGVLGSIKTMIKLVKQTNPLNNQMMLESWAAAQKVQPDLIIFHPKTLGAIHIAEKFGAPAIMATLQPMMVPTAQFPPIGLPELNLGHWYNKQTYKLITLGYRSYAKMVNKFRVNQLGLSKFPKSSGTSLTAAGDPIPVLHGFSRHIVPRPTDWPDHAFVNGYWFLEQSSGWEPPADLQAFLEKGNPPVYVGFGSMAGRNPQRLANIVVTALQKANVRGIVATGWGGLHTSHLPDTIFKIDQAPHDWLFPRMSAVVHHGGAGTTAAGLKAGKPTLICSFFGDQPFWGKRVAEQGIGPDAIPQKKLTVDKLTTALHTLTTDTAMRQKAAAIGAKIQAEDGVAHAVAIIESVMQTHAQKEKMIS